MIRDYAMVEANGDRRAGISRREMTGYEARRGPEALFDDYPLAVI